MLARWIDVRAHERQQVQILVAFAFCLGLAQVFLASAAISLFLDAWPATMLPIGYIGIGIALPLVGWGYAALERRVDLPRLLLINLGVVALSLLAWRWLIELPWPGWVMLLYIWWSVVWSLINLALWGLVGRMFDVRQTKRLNGVVGAGEVLAMVIGGFSIGFLVRPLGAANLLLLSVAAIGLAMIVLGRLVTRHRSLLRGDDDGSDSGAELAIGAQFKDNYLRLIFINSGLAWLVYYVVDNAFYSLASERFPDADAMAGLVGRMDAVVGVLLLVSRLLLAAPLLASFGVRGGLLSIPLVIGLGAAGVVVCSHLDAPALLIFVLAAAVKVGEAVCRDSIFRATLQVLYQPLPPSRRLRAQVTTESLVDPMGAVLAALLLLFLANGLQFAAERLFQVLLGLFVIWAVLALRLHGQYLRSLRRALARRAASGSSAELLEGASSRILKQALTSEFPSEIAFALDGLRRVDPREYLAALPPLLQHANADVRCLALSGIAGAERFEAVDAVRRLAWHDPQPQVRGAALRALAALGADQSVDELAPALRDPQEAVRAGATVGLISHGGIQGILLAGNELLAASVSADCELRRSAAALVGEIGNPAFYHPLLRLLADADTRVVLAALQAAARLRSPALWPALLPALDRASLRGYAIEALRGGGTAAAKAISARIASPHVSLAQQSRLVRTLAVIDDEHARAELLAMIGCANRELREQVLAALVRQSLPIQPGELPQVLAQIDHERTDAIWLLQQLAACRTQGDLSLLPPLREQLAAARRRMLLLLQLCHDRDAMEQVRDRISDSSAERRAYALELLDNLLQGELKARLLPLFDAQGETATLEALRVPAAETQSAQRRRLHIEQTAFEWGCSWLQASTICALDMRDPTSAARVREREDAPGLAGQAAEWWLARADREFTSAQRSEVEWQFVGNHRVGLLREVEIFAEAGESVLARIAERLSEFSVRRGQLIVDQGEIGDSLYVIAAGSVGVHVRASGNGDAAGKTGARPLRIATLHAPDIFGEFSLIDGEARAALVKADTLARLYRLEIEDFYDLLFDQPDITRRLIALLGERLRSQLGYGRSTGIDARPLLAIAASGDSMLDEDGLDALADPLRCRLLLQSVPLLSGLPEPLIATISANLKPLRVRAGERVYAEGEAGRTVYLIAAGRIRQHRGDSVLIERGPRDLFGDFSILDPHPRTHSASALEDSLLLRLDKELLRDLLMLWPELARNLLRDLVQRNRTALHGPATADESAAAAQMAAADSSAQR